MGDWADDLANDWVKDIKAGLLDEPALAMKLRNIEAQAEVAIKRRTNLDLLEALKALLATIEDAVGIDDFGGPMVDNARAAIAKAEGR